MLEIMRKNLLKLGAVISALLLGGYSIANAVPMDLLTLSDGLGDSVSLSVGGSPVYGGNATGVVGFNQAGAASWSGSLGVWTVSADAGYGPPSPGYGTAQLPVLDLNVMASSTGAGNLTFTWSVPNLGTSPGGFVAGNGGTLGTGASLKYSTFYSTANALPPAAGTTLTSPLAYITPGGFNGSDSATVGLLNSPFSLTQTITIIDTRAATSSDYTTLTAVSVPDAGSTLILLGTTMSMLGVYSRSRSKRQKA